MWVQEEKRMTAMGQDHKKQADSIVQDALLERESLETKTLAEQGRQRVRSQQKRVKNFFQMETTGSTN